MIHPILMPKPGQMTEECVLVAWHKDVGDAVHKGDVLFEIETDKSVMDVEAFDDGVLLARLVEEGETVPVNAVCAYVGQPGDAIPDAPAKPAAASVASAQAPAPPSGAAASTPSSLAAVAQASPRAAGGDASTRPRISPRATRLAAEAGIDPRTIDGTGPDGRIVERDVRAAIATRHAPVTPPGRATSAAASAASASAATAAATVAVPAAVPSVDGEAEMRPLSRMRRIIADRLTTSWTTTPHFTVTVAVDVTRLQALRAELKAGGTHLTVTDFILAATAQSLVDLPDVNSRTDGLSVWARQRVHLGLAVSLPTGLVVPVIRDADRLGLVEIHHRAAGLAAAAREGTLAVDDMTGSTFTVSNLGMIGVEEFSAIINPGEAAILAVASAIPSPVVLGDGIAIRSIMRLTLSADHRIVDGELAARFLNAIRRRLEDAEAIRGELANT